MRTEGFWAAVNTILGTNIIRADTLADGSVIELVSYRPGAGLHLHTRMVGSRGAGKRTRNSTCSPHYPGVPQRERTCLCTTRSLPANPKPTVAKTGRKR